MELECKDLKLGLDTDRKYREKAEADLEKVRVEIAEKEAILDELIP